MIDAKKIGLRIFRIACIGLLICSYLPTTGEANDTHTPPAEMVLVPGGTYEMGDAFGEGWDDETPTHPVYISAFYMDSTEITNALWDDVATWAALNGYHQVWSGGERSVLPTHPATEVSWYAVVKWANARSEREGLTPCYTSEGEVYRSGDSVPRCDWSANGYRLPTEAEWEMAARGGAEGHRFPWDDNDTIQHGRANYFSASFVYDTSPSFGYHPQYTTAAHLCTSPSWYNHDPTYTSPVGSFAPNGYGLYDMAGNVWEWCWDWYFFDYYARSPATDPIGPSVGTYRVRRGGSWCECASRCCVAARSNYWPTCGYFDIGFRLVRTEL
jgi:formylglycine-generating enzyme required for sulfatase activity